jgi:hypothetical protein
MPGTIPRALGALLPKVGNGVRKAHKFHVLFLNKLGHKNSPSTLYIRITMSKCHYFVQLIDANRKKFKLSVGLCL